MQSFQRLLGWATSIFGLNSILRGPVGHPRGKLQTRPRPVQCRVPEPANPRGEKLDPPPPPSGLKPAGFGFKPARLPSLAAPPVYVLPCVWMKIIARELVAFTHHSFHHCCGLFFTKISQGDYPFFKDSDYQFILKLMTSIPLRERERLFLQFRGHFS
jgi:hypothetical protein